MKEITVLKVAPMCVPEVVTLKNGLRSLQEAVSIDAPSVGLIEIINLDSKTAILCNEEGKLAELGTVCDRLKVAGTFAPHTEI